MSSFKFVLRSLCRLLSLSSESVVVRDSGQFMF